MITYPTRDRISEPLGDIITKTFDTNTTGWLTTVAAATIGIANSRLEFRNGAGDFANYIQFNDAAHPHRYTMLDKWIFRVRFDIIRDATSFGFAVGVKSIRTGDILSSAYRLCCETGGAFAGKFLPYVLLNDAGSLPSGRRQSSSTDGLPAGAGNGFNFTSGVQHWFEVEKNANNTTMRLKDLSETVLLEHTYTHNITAPNWTNEIHMHNTGRFCIWYNRGNLNVHEVQISSDSLKRPYWAFIGDSNMQGYFAANMANRYTTQAAGAYSSVVLAGISDRLIEVEARLPEILAINPRNVYINIGSNDITGANNPSWATNYTTVLNTLLNAGINVVVGTPLARNGVDFQPVINYFNTNYPNLIQVDVWNQSRTGTNLLAAYNSGDNIHASPNGNNLLRDFLKPFIDRT